MFSLVTTLVLASFFFFFFNDTATTEIYTLSLHDALPISISGAKIFDSSGKQSGAGGAGKSGGDDINSGVDRRSEEHTSELQSQSNLVCRLLLEKKKKRTHRRPPEHVGRSSSQGARVSACT